VRTRGPVAALVTLAGVFAFAVAFGGCGDQTPASTVEVDDAVAHQVAAALTAACPEAPPSDEGARALCAARLSDDKALSAVMREPFLWGGQKAGTSYHPEESNMNRFNVLVWRRMYLSLMMFTGEATFEKTADGLTVVHLPVRFRNELEPGSYPYPFWHSAKKWDSYQLSREVLLIIEGGKWVAAMRGAEQDASRPRVAHTWSGLWHWQEGDVAMPYVSLYGYLLSPGNPSAARLDDAYRELSNGLRAHACFMCHSPDNHAAVAQLEFFNYPNQALYSRRNIVTQLNANTMPPATNDLGLAAGIADAGERAELVALAREFEAAGDAALSFEGELKPAAGP
jgi:hypothetical protein